MGHIKEPKGVDFVIQSAPLTENDRNVISAFIADYKAKRVHKTSISTKKISSIN